MSSCIPSFENTSIPRAAARSPIQKLEPDYAYCDPNQCGENHLAVYCDLRKQVVHPIALLSNVFSQDPLSEPPIPNSEATEDPHKLSPVSNLPLSNARALSSQKVCNAMERESSTAASVVLR